MSLFPVDARHLFLLQKVQIVSGAHLASYLMDNGSVSSGLKREGRDAGQSHTLSAEVEKTWSCNFTPPICIYAYKGTPILHFPLASALSHQLSKI